MSDRSLFERAMREVERLEGPAPRVHRPTRRRSPARSDGAESGPRLASERFGDHVEGRAEGVPERTLTALVAGEPAVERTIDLHGLPEEEARLEVRHLLRSAWRTGQRCVRIVHGRGLRSPAGAVLKEAVSEWLAEAPHARWIAAFTSAGRRGARGGATVVLLRERTGGGDRARR